MGFVYVGQDKNKPGLCKIGRTNSGNVTARLASFFGKKNSPYEGLRLKEKRCWEVENAFFMEKVLHTIFRRDRINGSELFSINITSIDAIMAIKSVEKKLVFCILGCDVPEVASVLHRTYDLSKMREIALELVNKDFPYLKEKQDKFCVSVNNVISTTVGPELITPWFERAVKVEEFEFAYNGFKSTNNTFGKFVPSEHRYSANPSRDLFLADFIDSYELSNDMVHESTSFDDFVGLLFLFYYNNKNRCFDVDGVFKAKLYLLVVSYLREKEKEYETDLQNCVNILQKNSLEELQLVA